MDFIKLKKIIILVLALPVMYFAVININSFFNAPDIKVINIPDMTDFSFKTSKNTIDESSKNLKNTPAFEYKLIGYRSGDRDSSVILKKGNKEFLVAKGEKLDGIYELIEVNNEQVVFRSDEKLYKIDIQIGKN